MLAGEREVYILGLLEQQGVVTVAQITSHSGCAPETARRDLRRLEARGLLTRTYGGGIRVGGSQARTQSNNGSAPGTRTTLVDQVDVMVVTPSDTAATRLLADRARRLGVPIVAESHNYPGATTVVAIDDYRAGMDLGRWVVGYARRHLQGHVHVLDVTAPFANTNARSRGFADGLRELPPASRTIYRVDAQGLREIAQRIAADALTVHPEINVIFGINDDSALGALDAYRAAGLPEEALLVVSFGLEGKATRDLLDRGGPYRAGVAMFPELVGRICVDAAVCAYHGCHLAERTFTPFAIVTADNLYDYYGRKEANGTWQLNPARARHLLTTSPSVALIAQCRHQRLPARVGYVKIFSSHEWYQNMERAMQAQAQELGVSVEVVDASQDWEREIDAMKHAIGSAAARYVADDDTIFLDSGRTTAYMAEALRGREGIRVITNSLTVLAALDGERGIDLVSTGGVVRHESHALVGSAAEATCRDLRVDKTFIGGAGISVDFGLSNSNMAEAAIKQAMIKAARQVFVLADHTKIGVESLVKIAPLSSITTLITDSSLSAHDRAALTQGGVDVIIAEDRS